MKRSDFIKKSALTVGALGVLSCADGNETQETVSSSSTFLPPKLKKGDTIALFAPAGAVFNKKHINKTGDVLKSLGYNVFLAESLNMQSGYFSGTDEFRLNEFHQLIENNKIKALIAMRGGWGCARLLPNLDLNLIKENPKIIMGYSDLTSLLNFITEKTGLITFHGIMGYSTWNSFAISQFKQHLVSQNSIILENPKEDRKTLKTWKNGKAIGQLCGGNLSVLVTQIGTVYEPNWKDKILFLEETNEEPYRVDRMLYQLKYAGVFEKIKGLVIGKFNKCVPEEPEKSYTLDEVFTQYFKDFNKPMYSGASFGHVVNKFILPIGKSCEINADLFTIKIDA